MLRYFKVQSKQIDEIIEKVFLYNNNLIYVSATKAFTFLKSVTTNQKVLG